VRFVVHLDLPEDLESYYQEAGRGGRDGNKAYAVLLWEPKDTHDLQSRMVQKFPDPEEVRLAYRALTNHLQLAAGSGQDATYSIDLNAIAKNFTMPVSVLHNSFKVLESEGYLAFNEAFYSPSRIQFIVDKHTLYDYQLRNPAIDKVIQLLLRSYSGLFEGFVKIDERDLAKRNKTEAVKIIEALRLLQNHAIIDYTESSDKPMVTFIQPCVFPEKLIFSKETYFRRKALAASKMESVIKYLDDGVCRQKKLLNYFGEKTAINCGHCDVCLKNHTAKKVNSELEIKIIETLRPKALRPDEIVTILSSYQQDLILKQVKWMVDEQLIVYNSNKTLSVKEDILIQKNDNVKND
jgi:ATP-dependent DNA helicase RecQ